MELRKIGSLSISVIGVGCNNFGKRVNSQGTNEVISAALDAGINFFDTADIYGGTLSEEYLGKALSGRRGNAVIATKFGMPIDETRKGAKPAYIRQAVEDSLRRLGTDYVDLYQLHQPDPLTPIGETLEALDRLVKAGKVREIGCSNFSADQMNEAMTSLSPAKSRFTSVQNEYSLLQRGAESAVIPACKRHGVAFIPFFPLASGLLTGKYRLDDPLPESGRFGPQGWGRSMYTNQNLEIVGRLASHASKIGMSMLELSFSWLLSQPCIASVIAGAMTAEQVALNATAFKRHLTADELKEISNLLNQGHGE